MEERICPRCENSIFSAAQEEKTWVCPYCAYPAVENSEEDIEMEQHKRRLSEGLE